MSKNIVFFLGFALPIHTLSVFFYMTMNVFISRDACTIIDANILDPAVVRLWVSHRSTSQNHSSWLIQIFSYLMDPSYTTLADVAELSYRREREARNSSSTATISISSSSSLTAAAGSGFVSFSSNSGSKFNQPNPQVEQILCSK